MGCATIAETFGRFEEMHMASLKRGALVASALLLIAMLISACNQPYSQQPTPTASSPGPSLFESPIVQTPGAMGTVESFGTATALALSGTPLVGIPTQTLSLPLDGTAQSLLATLTPTPLGGGPLPTSTLAIGQPAATSGALPTSAPVGFRPATYELRRGEFPYCIARRYDLNPQELLTRNGLTSAEAYNLATGTVLTIPQSGSFPGTRALRAHTIGTTYTVASSTETVYSVACLFGDVDPARIMEVNNLSGATLTVGQQLTIP
jgi:LysM repeat protein